MIQNAAMFLEVAPVASMPPGRGTAFGLQPAGREGAFAKVLQGSLSGEAVAKSGTSDSAAVNAPGAGQPADLAKAQQMAGESDGKDASVAGPDQAKGPDGSELLLAVLAAEAQQGTPVAQVAQSGAAMVTADAGSLAAQPGRAADDGAEMSGLVSVAAAQETGTTTGSHAQQEGTAVAASADAVQTRPTLVWSAAERARVGQAQTGPAAEKVASLQAAPENKPAAQHTAMANNAQQQDGAAAPQARPSLGTADVLPEQRMRGEVNPAQSVTAADKGQELSQVASLQQAEVKNVAPAVRFTTDTTPNAQQAGAAAPGARPSVATAGSFVPTPVLGASHQAAPATPALDAVKEVPAEVGKVASPAATDLRLAGAPSEGESAKVVMQTGAATGATQGAQREVPGSDGKAQGQAATVAVAKEQPERATVAQPGAAPSQDKAAQPAADGRYAKAAEGAQDAAAKGGAEQAAVAPKASVEDASGTKTASAVIDRLAPSQGGRGQDLSGDAGKQGHPGQKAQGELAGQVEPGLMGAQTQVAAEAAQPEMKQASQRSALHQSILSQVQDGVVSHDGKGNGQMSIRLNPGDLGELKIQVRMEDNLLRVEVQADNRMVKDLLMSNLESLKEALSSKNFTMAGFDVSTGGGGFNSSLPGEKRNSRQQSLLRTASAGGYPGQEDGRVNYLTGEVNNLLDVRF